MAVFTPLSDAQVAAFLEKFDVGSFVSLKGVAKRHRKFDFFCDYRPPQLVLTLFEQGEHAELPFFVELLDYLDEHRLPVPGTIHDREGIALHSLEGQAGVAIPAPAWPPSRGAQCSPVPCLRRYFGSPARGVKAFPGHRPNPRDLNWLQVMHHKVLSYLSPADQTLMKDEVDDFESAFMRHGELPQGALHGDLFRDNTLFEGDQLGGIIDFYNGCTGDLLFDLAIVINDWASNDDGTLNAERYNTLLSAYLTRRPLTAG
ncbi:phosphotransferase [Halomonas sp. PA16-9]|uniref:phosphotransferase n=1 Tax=Halomonas sp. PA16-9 TaxID=2576841 RepID=UPI0018C4D588